MSVIPSGVYTRVLVDGQPRTVDAISLSDDGFIAFVGERLVKPDAMIRLSTESWNHIWEWLPALDERRRRLILWKLNEVGLVVALKDEMRESLRSVQP